MHSTKHQYKGSTLHAETLQELLPTVPGPTGRGHRKKFPTAKILDMQPEGPTLKRSKKRPLVNEEDDHGGPQVMDPIVEPSPEPTSAVLADDEVQNTGQNHLLPVSTAQGFKTVRNIFGLARQYFTKPVRIPDLQENDAPSQPVISPSEPDEAEIRSTVYPYPNLSSFLYAYAFAAFDRISDTFQSAVANLINIPGFMPADIKGVGWQKMRERVAQLCRPWEDERHGWQKREVSIQVPHLNKSKGSKVVNQSAPDNGNPEDDSYTVEFWSRPIVPLLKSILASDESKNFHYEPYEQRWQRPTTASEERPQSNTSSLPTDEPATRVYDELYTGDAWLEEHRKIQEINLPPEESDEYPRAIAAMMLWSDSTHLAEFGQAKAWPIYLSLGNQSKYERAKPNTHALHHLAYLPSVSVS